MTGTVEMFEYRITLVSVPVSVTGIVVVDSRTSVVVPMTGKVVVAVEIAFAY